MADPATPTGATPGRRDLRRDRSRRRVRRGTAVVVAVVLATAVALVAFDVVHLGGDDKPSAAGTVRAPRDAVAAHGATTTTTARDCRPLTADDPLRLWIGGDSLAGSLGPSLGKITGATGVVQPYFDSRVSSGLANPGFFDWPDHATTVMAELNPEVVVFIIGTNDFSAVTGDWKSGYEATVDSMMKTLVGPGRTVYWLGAPTLKDSKMDTAVVAVNAAAQEVAKRHRTVHYVDTHQLFAGSDGSFAADLPDETGKVVTMRTGDGIHLTPDGADYLARQVYKLVDAQCGVTEQKVEGRAKQTIQAAGSTQVAPGAGSSGSSGNGTIQTTPPATAAPTTTTPVTTTPATAPPTTAVAPTTAAPTTTIAGKNSPG